MRQLCVLLAVLSIPALASSKVPESEWQTGTLQDVQQEERSYTTEHYHSKRTTIAEHPYSIPHYTIETDKYLYETIANGGDRRRALPVTVNGPLKYALIGNDFYIQDEQGKEHKMTVLKKTLKAPVLP